MPGRRRSRRRRRQWETEGILLDRDERRKDQVLSVDRDANINVVVNQPSADIEIDLKRVFHNFKLRTRAYAWLMIFCIVAGIAGSLGMTIADLIDPVYVTSAPKTFVLKLCIGLISGFVAHRIARITEDHDHAYILRWTFLASAAGLGFNVIADPVAGYIYKTYLLGIPQDVSKIMATWAAGVTAFNAAVGTLVVVAVYSALRPVLKRSGQFFRL